MKNLLIWIDNSSAISWLKKQPHSDIFADWLFRILGLILIRNNFSLWGQHLAGNLNFIADCLSRLFGYDLNEMLIDIIYKCHSNKFKPTNPIFFQELPQYLKDWTHSVLQCLMQEVDLLQALTKQNSLHGNDSKNFALNLKLETKIYKELAQLNDIDYHAPSLPTLGGSDFEMELLKLLKKRLFGKSYKMLEKPLTYMASGNQ